MEAISTRYVEALVDDLIEDPLAQRLDIQSSRSQSEIGSARHPTTQPAEAVSPGLRVQASDVDVIVERALSAIRKEQDVPPDGRRRSSGDGTSLSSGIGRHSYFPAPSFLAPSTVPLDYKSRTPGTSELLIVAASSSVSSLASLTSLLLNNGFALTVAQVATAVNIPAISSSIVNSGLPITRWGIQLISIGPTSSTVQFKVATFGAATGSFLTINPTGDGTALNTIGVIGNPGLT
ncbi:hypothetical protein M422DRAFT_264196 [Sphaerobolus stellatus SS14]|uniref:Uncharacterized protein n=1 Tax=Sphaerobolus stellatus (strain SS14) TaxID=990650 RepID=A0A0C9UG08_SPHS4|nr:hypothetical protein M422DRAFT_264196 [Sphaerobolus stellatus SS14]